MNTDFNQIINSASARINNLYEQINKTAKKKNINPKDWQDACYNFRHHISEIDFYMAKIYESPNYLEEEIIEFAICFLEVNPIFFRSGYFKQIIIKKLKRSQISISQEERLREVIIDAVKNRGTREYKIYCNLAISLKNKNLIENVKQLSFQNTGAIRSRAKLMLRYIN